MSDAKWGARIDALEAELRGVTARVEAALRTHRQSDTLAREYSATQHHAQDMEAAMLRWQQRAEAAEAMLAATFVSENRALDVRYEALDNERAADAHNEILRQDLQAATARAEAAGRERDKLQAYLAEAFRVGALWQCPDCHKICTQEEGAADEWPHLCDDCWAKATASQQSEVQP